MKEHSHKPKDSLNNQERSIKGRYRQFRFTLLLAITIISLVPAIILSVVGYFQYLALLEKQEVIMLNWHANYTKTVIAKYIQDVQPSIKSLVDETLKKKLSDINKGVLDDTFLIDKKGSILTPSTFFPGDVPFTLIDALTQDKIIATNNTLGRGKTYYFLSPIKNSPWLLVLIKDGPIHANEWWVFQIKLVVTFIACTILSLMLIYQLVNLLTYRIRVSDIKRMKLFSEIGHTNRLATIGRLAAGVAHEINNPLAVIDQKAGLIDDYLEFSEDFEQKERFSKAIKGINNNVARCKTITQRLLGFARKMEVTHEEVQINEVIEEVLGFLEKEALYNHITLQLDLVSDIPSIYSDKGQLQQILLNIVNNAIDAIGKNGSISISTKIEKKKNIRIDIADNGPGIEPAVMKHIFDPFFTTKDTGKGTGLGLAITYGLTTKLGGDIKVKSTPGKGACFSLTFPISKNH